MVSEIYQYRKHQVLICIGFILCKLDASPDNNIRRKYVRSLGEYLRNCVVGSFQPYFLIHEVNSTAPGKVIIMSREILDDMTGEEAIFKIGPVTIKGSSEGTETAISLCLRQLQRLPISGFPRAMFARPEKKSMFQPNGMNFERSLTIV